MGLFSWLFGKKKKTNDDIDIKTNNIESESKKTITKIESTASEAAPNEQRVPPKNKKSAPKSEIAATNVQKETVANQPSAKKTEQTDTKPKITSDTEPKSEPKEQTLSKGYTGKFEINKAKDGKYFFNLYASNKVGIATSQMYSTAQSALIGVKSVITNAPKAPIEDQTLKNWEALPYPKWELYLDNGNKYRFRLNAPNGSCVCHSQGYTTKNACKNGIDSIIRSSKNAEIEKNYLAKKDAD